MSRDLLDDNYYVTSGGKIPVKWTAPEVTLLFTTNAPVNYLSYSHRHCTTESTHCSVMFGVMVAYYMRYGVWDTNLMRTCQVMKYGITNIFNPSNIL